MKITQVLLWETAMILEEHEITFKPSPDLKRGTPQSIARVHSWARTKPGLRLLLAGMLKKIQLLYCGGLTYIRYVVSGMVNTSKSIQFLQEILYLHTDASYITEPGQD